PQETSAEAAHEPAGHALCRSLSEDKSEISHLSPTYLGAKLQGQASSLTGDRGVSPLSDSGQRRDASIR
ncbi:MAG: hypothetical protein J0L73_25470, partial [Verrucomicrobia bacterium]|nr:hypothetical protein [Verrucomicrobiota bacterium]